MARSDVTISVDLDSSQLNKSLRGLTQAVTALGAAFAAAFAGAQVVRGIQAITEAASVQEDAINALNTSLKLAGTFSEEASQDFQNFASALQEVTTIGDETTLQLAALARNFTQTNQQTQELTAAALDLSAATGISLESAVINLGKTLGGLTGELGETVPALKELTAEQLRAGEGIAFVQERFEGAAESLRNTFSGAVEAASNSFGDFLEELGFAITQNPAVIEALNQLSQAFSEISSFVSDNRDEIAVFVREGISGLIRALAVLAEAVVDNFDTINRTIQTFGQLALLTFQSVKQGLSGIALVFVELARSFEFYREVLAFAVGDTDGAVQSIRENREALAALSEEIKSDIEGTAKDSVAAFNNLIDTINAPNLTPENNALLKTLQLISEQLTDIADKAEDIDVSNITGPGASGGGAGPAEFAAGAGIGGLFTELVDEFATKIVAATDFFVDSVTEVGNNLAEAALGIGTSLKNIIVSGAEGFADKAEDEQVKIAKQSAQAFVAESAGLLTDAFLPGAGQFVTALLELAKDPESFQAFIQGFTKALPEVIDSLVEALPVIIDGLVEALPQIIQAFIDAIPQIIDAFIDALPEIIAVLIENAPRIAIAFVNALIEAAPKIAVAIVQGIGEGLKRVFDNLVEDIKDFLGTGGGGGTLGRALSGDVGGAFGEVAGAFGFANGGVVPPGFPNDSFPARLTSGEVVLNEEQQQSLMGPITVNLVLNEETIASTILELNRDNRRLA